MSESTMMTGTHELPMIATRGVIALPHNEIKLDVGREQSVRAVQEAMEHHQGYIFLASQKNPLAENPKIDEIFQIGGIARITARASTPSGAIRINLEVITRAKRLALLSDEEYLFTSVESLTDVHENNDEEFALLRQVLTTLDRYLNATSKPVPMLMDILSHGHTASELTDLIAYHLTLPVDRKQEYLEANSINERLYMILKDLYHEVELARIEARIENEVKSAFEESQREYYLREKMRVIREELGEKGSKEKEAEDLKTKIEALTAPDFIKEKLMEELKRYEMMPQASPESGVIRTYIDWVMAIPWGVYSQDNFDIVKAKAKLDAQHYGLEKVKERIIEFLAVKKLTGGTKGDILCLVGPPGVGKTSLVQSIAESMDKPYVKIALGGVRDESEIRGHRRTYLGSMPGKFAQAMKKAKVMNPVLLLDEIDKMSADFKGDPTSALLEVLDPEQNSQFNDHYIEENIDLSNVFFIATANYYEGIPAPLMDRMEIIELGSYTEEEKFEIAKRHLLEKELKAHGLTKKNLTINKAAMYKIIREYTRESGVRNLERQIATICRKVASLVLADADTIVKVDAKNLVDYLGKARYHYSSAERKDQVGVVTGLAYTAFGGDILPVEVAYYPGRESMVLTGQLGDVMKESAQTAMSYVKSRAKEFKIDPEIFEKNTVHIHVPEGAVPKDGPSAGITMATAIVSALTNQKVRKDLGMTGEITLRGNVLPIGGLKEKSMAANRSGLKTILIPQENERDIDEVPETVKKQLTIIPVAHLDDVLAIAFTGGKKDES
ncbi:MAG: endopeptidase La [Culicoidibacterales bacterium]